MMLNRKQVMLSLLIVLFAAFTPLGIQAQSDTEDRVIVAVVASEDFDGWLDTFPNYEVNTWGPDEDGFWGMEFISADGEWLGYARIHEESLEIVESYAPRPLDPEVYQEQLERVTALVMSDPEVLALMNDTPDLWQLYTDFDRWEQQWYVSFHRGIEGYTVYLWVDDDYISISEIIDNLALSEEEAEENARNEAISLAYSADNIDGALAGTYEWTTYVEAQGDDVWSVSFVANEETLITVVVNIEDGTILMSK